MVDLVLHSQWRHRRMIHPLRLHKASIYQDQEACEVRNETLVRGMQRNFPRDQTLEFFPLPNPWENPPRQRKIEDLPRNSRKWVRRDFHYALLLIQGYIPCQDKKNRNRSCYFTMSAFFVLFIAPEFFQVTRFCRSPLQNSPDENPIPIFLWGTRMIHEKHGVLLRVRLWMVFGSVGSGALHLL